MELQTFIEKMTPRQNGAYIKVKIKRDMSNKLTKAALNSGYDLYKEITTSIKKGVKDPNPLLWGTYYRNSKTIIQHKGKFYAKFKVTNNQPKVKYFVNGNEIDEERLLQSGLLKNSYWYNKYELKADPWLIVKMENIQEIYTKSKEDL